MAATAARAPAFPAVSPVATLLVPGEQSAYVAEGPLSCCDASGAVIPWPREGFTRFVCLSDTHSKVDSTEPYARGDVLLHAGDWSSTGTLNENKKFVAMIQASSYAERVVIAGNHDITMDHEFYKRSHSRFHYRKRQDEVAARALVTEAPGLHYLEDSGVDVFGHSIYGSPHQPEFCDWAFNLGRKSAEIAAKWAAIPTGVDVLLTHGPPKHHGGLCRDGFDAGCEILYEEVVDRIRPRVHVFGHIHEAYGVTCQPGCETVFMNASTCTLRYQPSNPAIVFDLSRTTETE